MSQRKALAVAVAAFFLMTTSCASAPRNKVLDSYPAGVLGHTTVIYYDVHGRTVADLRADMRRVGPKIADSSFVGETRSPMRWSWRTESTGASGCTIRDVTVSVNAQVTLPRWTPPADTEPGLAAEWTRFIAALETHEAGHKDISAKAGSDIVDRLRGLSGLCSQIGTRANDLAREIVDRASSAQKAYDAFTRHGLTQGTAFGRRGTVVTLSASTPFTLLPAPRPGTIRGFLTTTVERAWRAMPAVYTAVDLAINATDSTAHAVGDSLTARGKVGTTSLGELVDCRTSRDGPNDADSVDVALFVTSRLESSPPSNIVMTNTVQAVAHPSGAPPFICRSLGVIERRLVDELRRELAR